MGNLFKSLFGKKKKAVKTPQDHRKSNDSKPVEKPHAVEAPKKEEKKPVLSKRDILAHELDIWGIPETHSGREYILVLADIDGGVDTYTELLDKISAAVGNNNKGAISQTLNLLIKRADFSMSLYSAISNITAKKNSPEFTYRDIIVDLYKWINKPFN